MNKLKRITQFLASIDLTFPLLTKELVEQAARPRTYILRVTWALSLFAGFLFVTYQVITAGGRVPISSISSSTGAGRDIFNLVIQAQAICLFAFLPAMLVDAITSERESGTLDLLAITDLSLWDIILQKLASRLIPILTLLFMSMPLLAIAYTYGGLDPQHLASCLYALTLTAIQIGAIVIMLTADSPNAAHATLSTYIRLPFVYIKLLILGLILSLILYGLVSCLGIKSWLGAYDINIEMFVPSLLVFNNHPIPFYETLLFTLPAWASIFYFLRKAHLTLNETLFVDPAFPRKPSFQLAIVEEYRRHRAEDDRGCLPDDQPVAWRENSSKTMTQFNKVYWVAMLVTYPCILIVLARIGTTARDPNNHAIAVIVTLGWTIAAATLALTAASAFATERANQTLSILLATPIPTPQLIAQKLAGPHRFALMAVPPFIITFVLEIWQEIIYFQPVLIAKETFYQLFLFIIPMALSLVIYPMLAIWLGAFLSMRIPQRGRVILTILSVLAAWGFILPLITDNLLQVLNLQYTSWTLLKLLSPITLINLVESNQLATTIFVSPWLAITLNFTFYAALTFLLRLATHASADKHLGRIPEPRASQANTSASTAPSEASTLA